MVFNTQNTKYRNTRCGGYTVIELIVAVSLFSVAVLMVASSFLGVITANRKTLAIRTAMDNLNFAIESMVRDMKTGSSYHCGTSGFIDEPRDCPDGGGSIVFEGQEGSPGSISDQKVYKLDSCISVSPQNPAQCGQIVKSTDGGVSFFPITAPPPDLTITGLAFRVYGSAQSPVDNRQPRITIVILGSAGSGTSAATFDIQTTISQRLPDT